MTIVMFDGLDLYGNAGGGDVNDMMQNGWSCGYTADLSLPAGRFGGKCIQKNNNGGREDLYRDFGAALSTFTIGLDVNITTLGRGLASIMNGNSIALMVYAENDGSISVRKQDGGAILGKSVDSIVTPNTWFYLEAACVIDAAAGKIALFYEGGNILELTGINTANGVGAQMNRLGVPEHAGSQFTDNVYVSDQYASIGPIVIEAYHANADDLVGAWTPNSGSNLYSRLSDATSDGDSSYISTTTVGDKFRVGLEDVTGDQIVMVKAGVISVAINGTASVAIVAASGGAEKKGPVAAQGGAYARRTLMMDKAPDGSAWTKQAASALAVGMSYDA